MSLIWPFPNRDPSQYCRIDQGWDLQVPVGTPIYAVADGTISYAHDPTGFGDPYPVLNLDTPEIHGSAVYYGHNHPEVAAGSRVKQGDVICHALVKPGGNAADLPGWLEIGWWIHGPTGDGQAMHDALINAPVVGEWKVKPMYNPPLALHPIVCSVGTPNGAILVGTDGGVYTFGSAQFHGAPAGQPYWGARVAAEIRCATQFAQLPYTIKDTAGEFYDYGYQPGQPESRW